MLKIVIPDIEEWDESKECFVTSKGTTLQLEHSLISLSKWESKWNEPFLGNKNMTDEKTIDYIRCMTLTQGVDPDVYRRLTNKNFEEIRQYIEAPMTATWFAPDRNKHGHSRGEIVTSEVIYYWMIALNIPFECEKWHLNRLITLVQVCNEKNKPAKKMSRKEIMSSNKSLNAARRAAMNSKG